MNTPCAPSTDWPDGYRHWTGSIQDLARTAAQVLAALDPQVKPPTTRLLRYYQQQGVLGRGRKDGNRAVFGFEDLERVVAAKGLVKNNWSLSNAASLIDTQAGLGTPVTELLYADTTATDTGPGLAATMAEEHPDKVAAPTPRQVVARLMAKPGHLGAPAPALAASCSYRSTVPVAGSLVRSVAGPIGTLAATSQSHTIPPAPPAPVAPAFPMPVQALQPAPWMSVYLDPAAARLATPAQRQAALDALKAALAALS